MIAAPFRGGGVTLGRHANSRHTGISGNILL
jgi:hypothetical protein